MFLAGGDLSLVLSVLLTRVGEDGGGGHERSCCGCAVVILVGWGGGWGMERGGWTAEGQGVEGQEEQRKYATILLVCQMSWKYFGSLSLGCFLIRYLNTGISQNICRIPIISHVHFTVHFTHYHCASLHFTKGRLYFAKCETATASAARWKSVTNDRDRQEQLQEHLNAAGGGGRSRWLQTLPATFGGCLRLPLKAAGSM